ncbi:ParB/Srx family N-terminal domain-containing protein [Planktomarina sp.]|uniref:ParB/Srx family N-terminal domain-containing protein n=1 Tax=Planktomarina sp. TaxID=2024851 RepID=UPI003260A62F
MSENLNNQKVFGRDYGIVYGWVNKETGKKVIGSKVSGEPSTYITSLGPDNIFWQEYKMGKMVKHILAKPSLKMTPVAEWFALDFAMSQFPQDFYNIKNTAHKGDELVDLEIKRNLVNFISDEPFEDLTTPSSELGDRLLQLALQVEGKAIPSVKVPISVIAGYDRKQVRTVQTNHKNAADIKQLMLQNPAQSQELFGPIVCVVMPNGQFVINDGNTRLEAALLAQWLEAPCVYIPWQDLTDDKDELEVAMELFGSTLNRESPERKSPNSANDLKKQMRSILLNKCPKFNFKNKSHVEYGKTLIDDYFANIVPSRQKITSNWNAVLTLMKNESAELQIEGNLRTYSDNQLKRIKFEKYELNNIACVVHKSNKMDHNEVVVYAMNRMMHLGLSKGAIVVHYDNKPAIVKAEELGLVDKVRELIEFYNLDITVEELPFK